MWYMKAMGMLKTLLCAAAVALAAGAGVYAQEEETPDADVLLKAMRDMTVSQGNKDVSGTIRKNKLKVPFSLSARGETIVFQYNQDNVWHRFDARIKARNVDLLLVDAKGQARVMAASSYAQPIAGTDVCYEDLSLRFLYWKDGKVVTEGVETRVKGRDCWVVQVANPNPSTGQFAWVRMWVDKENGTSWQIDGYGRDGKLKKRFTITSVQKLSDGTWFFKQMKVEVRNPENPDRTIALDYLEMDDIKK